MFFSDISFIAIWWIVFFIIGIIFLPLTMLIFSNFFDRGYIFAKILGMLFISYAVFLLGTLKLLPFTLTAVIFLLFIWAAISIWLLVKVPPLSRWNLGSVPWKLFLFEELLFLAGIILWSFVRGNEPSIHGLEKYMDFGFVNSILRTDYFPAKDLWLTPLTINYYYFGHLVTAVLTKLSGIDPAVTYNLMIATLFAFTFTGAFSIVANLIALINTKYEIRNTKQYKNQNDRNANRFENSGFGHSNLFRVSKFDIRILLGGLLAGFLVALAGNLHTIYGFFAAYDGENPVPFWTLTPGFNFLTYWYPNATRFIPFTIHEFPLYSFVVSDLHGHVLSIPIVFTIIAVLLSIISKSQTLNPKQIQNSNLQNSKRLENLNFGNWNLFRIWNLEFRILLLAFLLAVAYMTNAWDGIIYALLTAMIFFYLAIRSKNYTLYAKRYTLIVIGSIIFSLPFSLFFKPFVSGVGVICAPEFLTNIGKLGPFLFEADHCQRSPLWQLLILHGFWYFWVVSFIVFLWKRKTLRSTLYASDIFVLILIGLSTLLLLLPEFIYAKDIYPAHYRANTMFKLGYEAFMMLGISTAYIIMRLISNLKVNYYWRLGYWVIGIIGLFLVGIYPYFAINSYYGSFKTYRGLDGLTYLRDQYPSDYEAIIWIRENIKGQPVILEAAGESYTDYARVSANTGLPTVVGWPVHEWLWRGSYDEAGKRVSEVEQFYTTNDIELAKAFIKKYNVEYVFMGDLERQKYPTLSEEKFKSLGNPIYQNGETTVYKIK